MSIYFQIADEKILSKEEFIKDIEENNWKHYIYQQVIEKPDQPGLVLVGGLFNFDSIEFDTNWNGRDVEIYLYNKDECWSLHRQALGIGCDADNKDNQIAYVHKDKTYKQCLNFIKTNYTVHFVNTNQIISFEAINY